MRKSVGILIGHYGPGTGNMVGTRDEWQYALASGGLLANMLVHAGYEAPIIYIDRSSPKWRSINSELAHVGGLKDRNFAIRANWAINYGVDCAIELHFNGADNQLAKGHEVWIDDDSLAGSPAERLAKSVNAAMGAAFVNHPNRGVKQKSFKVLSILHTHSIPACIVEPCFLFESILDDERRFREDYTAALFAGVKSFLARGAMSTGWRN